MLYFKGQNSLSRSGAQIGWDIPKIILWVLVYLSLEVVFSLAPATAALIGFNSYISPSNNELEDNFVQNSGFGVPQQFYQQSPSGGITGGSVTGYSGQNYLATAAYKVPSSFGGIGTTISLSMDFYYDAVFSPPAPGANAVRSFRLGLLDSQSGSFETYGDPSLYVGGVYSGGSMDLVAYSLTDGVETNIEVAQIALQPNQWLQLDADFTEVGTGEFMISTSMYALGPDGLAAPALLGLGNYLANGEGNPLLTSGSNTFSNSDMTGPMYAGFSVLSDGGITKGDDLVVPSAIPEPSTWAMMLLGFVGLGFVGYRRAEKGSRIPRRLGSKLNQLGSLRP